MNRKKKKGETAYQFGINIALMLFAVICILPFILLVMASLTDEKTLLLYGYSFFPKKFSLDSYRYLFEQSAMLLRAYGITLFVTVAGTSLSLIIMPMLAYPLSRKDFSKRNIFTFIVFFTMLFNGGLVPQYLMWTKFFHIKNTIFALIFPNLLINAFNTLLMRNYFSNNIPPELIESASIDGAGEFKTFFKIILPLSLPIMATVGLMVGIGYWNDWTNGLYYLTNQRLFSLQNLLNRILMDIQFLASSDVSQQSTKDLPSVGIRMAIAIVGILPIMALYPFFQRYFVKGITIGAVKG